MADSEFRPDDIMKIRLLNKEAGKEFTLVNYVHSLVFTIAAQSLHGEVVSSGLTSYSLDMYSREMDPGRGHVTCVGVIRPELLSPALKSMCHQNELELNRLKTEVETTLKPDCKKEDFYHPDLSWEKRDVMFTSAESLRNFGDNSMIGSDVESVYSTKGPTTFCYLCNTMEEHLKHQKKYPPKRHGKPRISYLAPPPTVKHKKETKPCILSKDALYKVEVFTADEVHASTDAQVFITIEGSEDILPKTKLHKSIGCAKFCFRRGTVEIFYIKGPDLGNLETLTVEIDGLEEKHSWCLEKIEVTDMITKDSWIFLCNKWLSLHIKDFKIKRQLKASPKEIIKADYKIIVHTGKKAFAGTDAKVFITLYGDRKNSPKILLKDPSKNCFENGSVDNFQVRLGELGTIRKIRIEHDGKGVAPGWFLDNVIVYNMATPKKKFYCYCNSWLSKDEGDRRLWKELPALNKPRVKGSRSEDTSIQYEIEVLTGDVKYGGTDANVFIQMFGSGGVTSEIPLDDAKNNFERNMVDKFKVKAEDVGNLEKILIGHDNSGVGAGWFLEKVTIRRFPPKDDKNRSRNKDKKERLHSGRKQSKHVQSDRIDKQTEMKDLELLGFREREMLSELLADSDLIRREKWAVPEVHRYSDGESSDWSDSGDSDGYITRGKVRRPTTSNSRRDSNRRRSQAVNKTDARRKSIHRSGRRQSVIEKNKDNDSQSENETDYVESRRKSEYKKVLYEEYFFTCHQWFSSDEGDRQIVRELACERKLDHFEE